MNAKKQKTIIIAAFIIMGFSAMISQIVLIRELMIFFTGNELVVGQILAIWLLWTALGSGVFGRITESVSRPIRVLATTFISMAFLLPLTFIFITLSKPLFSISAGEIFSPLYTFLIPLIALAPIGLSTGFLYTLGCKILSQSGELSEKVPGRVYFWEGIGAGIAGFLASIFLFRFFENYQVVIFLMIVNLLTALQLSVMLEKNRFRLTIYFLAIFGVTAIFCFFHIQKSIRQVTWGKLALQESKTTIYGNLAVATRDETVSFYENGGLLFSHPDLMSAEETVHFALLEHPQPKQVLLIGGDAIGCLSQILFHPSIEQVDFLLLDPELISLTLKYIPEAQQVIENKKIQVHYLDGRLFLKKTKKSYDLILVNLGAPQTTRVNRFFTREFYQLASQKLNADGIISFSLPSSDNVISDEQAEFLSCLYFTMKQIFPDIALLPGYSIHFLGCKSNQILTTDVNVLVSRINERNLPTQYIRDYYLRYRLTADRLNYVDRRIAGFQSKMINTDFRPVGFFYNIYLWLSSFNRQLIGTIRDFNNILASIMVGFLIGIFVLLLSIKFFIKQKPHSKKFAVTLTIIFVGCTAMSLEVLLIHGFQAIYGYAYYQLALILSGFMIGLAAGSWRALAHDKSSAVTLRRFIRFQIWLIIYPLIIYGLLLFLEKTLLPGLAVQVIFLLLISGLGFLCGHQFPAANDIILQVQKNVERTGGALYAWDLAGSVFGALLISTVLIPFFGVGISCLFFSLLSFTAFYFLL